MFKIQLKDILITVDEETCIKLKDPECASNYYEIVKAELDKENKSSTVCTLWKSSINPTEADHTATLALLSLRKEFIREFEDKKTTKNELWSKIAVKMNEMGFYVGFGTEGREKVRQKFANLHKIF